MANNPLEKRRVSPEEEFFARENAKKIAAIRDGLVGRPSGSSYESNAGAAVTSARNPAPPKPRREVCDAA